MHCECFKTKDRVDHIAKHPSTWFYQNIDPNDTNTFVLIMQIQFVSLQISMITYHYLKNEIKTNSIPKTNDEIFNKLFEKFCDSNDEYRSARLKLIPRIVDGPYPVKKVVENRPVLIASKVKHRYFGGKNYFEIDAQVDESYVAQRIIKLCYRFCNRLYVDMAWVIQGEQEDELPERIMLGITLQHLDFTKLPHIDAVDTKKNTSS